MSDEGFLKAAEEQEQALLTEIRKTDLFKRLEAVRAVIAAYKGGPENPPSKPNGGEHRERVRPTQEAIERHVARGTKTASIIAGAAHYLRASRKRATSGEITKVLEDQGIIERGTSGKLISSYLSNSDLFDNDQSAGGYGLAEWHGAG